jgi:A/G-specific adenine glycosylase
MPSYARFHIRLIQWFEANRQPLPWRQNRTPYRVWISEIMLQQTQVLTVIPYFERFISRFPDVQTLAAASLDEVLKVWEGLGYYSRARNLHRAAKKIAIERNGEFPATAAEWMTLPGIGRYTAGAIASLVFGEAVPVLDGNVIRVLTRWHNLDDDITQTDTKLALWALAEQMLPPEQPGVWNEALMELGQRICLPKNPDCGNCPVARLCKARLAKRQYELPIRARRKPLPHHEVAAGIIFRDDNQILIAKRQAEALLGGLWEFPGGKREEGESLPECLAREVREELGIEVEVGYQLAMVRHAYTHFKITLYAYTCRYISGDPQAIGCAEWRWTPLDQLDRYAFPRADHSIIEALKHGSQAGFAW